MSISSGAKLFRAFAALSLLFAALPAMAQVQVPGAADPGQTEQRLPKPDFGGVSSPSIEIPEVRVENAPAGAENVHFVLKGIVLEGVTAYPKSELESVFADQIGKRISLTDVYGIAQSITRKYRRDGYIITQAVIPEQTIDDGVVKIRVVEGYIDNVILQNGNDSKASADIAALAENLKKKRPLRSEDLERWLLLVNDTPGLSARSVIRPSASAVGGADIVIIHEIDPYEFSASADNFGSRYLGPYQLSGAARFNNPFGIADRFEVQYVTTANQEMQYLYGGYDLPLNNLGTRLKFDVAHTDTEPGYLLDQFDVNGYSQLYGAQVSHPFIRTRTQNLFTTLRFDYRDLSSKNIVDSDTVEDRIASVRLGADYNLYDNLWKPAVNEVSFTLSKGVNAFGASDENSPNMTRANGDPQYTKFELEMSRLQTVTDTINLLFGVSGQKASDPLLSSEEFGIGGRYFGRGYDPSEIVGDDGVAAKAEVQWSPPINASYLSNNQIFGFYDFGKVWNQEEAVSSNKQVSLASTGLGFRTKLNDRVDAEILGAVPLTLKPGTQDDNGARVYFSLSTEF